MFITTLVRKNLIKPFGKRPTIRSSFFYTHTEFNLVHVIEVSLVILSVQIVPTKDVNLIFVETHPWRDSRLDEVV